MTSQQQSQQQREVARAFVRAVLVAAALGLVVGGLSILFVAAVHEAEHWLWHSLPEALGEERPPWWLVLLAPAVGGVLAALAMRLPGHGGHAPAAGFGGAPVTLDAVPSALLAAFASLVFGAVLGPEAPLMALGTGIALWAAARAKAGEQVRPLYAAAGVMAALATILGNPVVGVFIVAELLVAQAGAQLFTVLLPGLVAAATAFLLFVGVGDWGGVGQSALAIPGIPVPETLTWGDVLWAPVIGAVVGAMLHGVRMAIDSGGRLLAPRPPLAVLPLAGVVVGGLALLYGAVGGQAEDLLFSGQTALPTVVASTSVGLLLWLAALKSAAFVVSAGAGFRGGLIFPMIAVAVAVGTAAAQILPDIDLASALAAAIAASLAGGMRLPVSGVIFAVLLLGAAGTPTSPVAVLAAVTAFLLAQALQARATAPVDQAVGTTR